MVTLGLSTAINSLNESTELTTLEQADEPLNVILPIANLNVPGSQESSIFTDTTLSSGDEHTCTILDNGSVSCWGDGDLGKLGNGNTLIKTTPTLTSSLGAGRTAVAISVGTTNTCAILDNGSVSCWGSNSNGQLGDGTTTYNRNTPTPTSSLGVGRTAVAISSGTQHHCVILDNGEVSCWGMNSYGQLGDGTTTNRYTPTQTSSLGTGRTAVAISSGLYHTCAILDNGSVSCWGDNDAGKLGDGTTTDRNTPSQTSSLGPNRTAVALSTGRHHTCAILDNGSVSCWGAGYYGALGGGSGGFDADNKYTPTPTSSLGNSTNSRTAVAISSGNTHTCAILDNGSVSCWGSGDSGQTGNGATSQQNSPTLAGDLGPNRTAVALSSGNYHTCAILDNGSVSCWGKGYHGQLGNGWSGPGGDQLVPVLTSSLGINCTAALSERDLDGDGILNIFDITPIGIDSDGDGVGDNSDAFPNDANETIDSDGDGVGNNADAFPNDASETVDSDGDGVGNNADAFPNDPNETIDSDGDGVGNNADAFPNDASETVDSDGDGVGDNSDAFPNDSNETIDSDGDGVGNNADAFPNDASETVDSDMDAVGDNADVFPDNANETMDSDMDSVGDNADAFPNDANETMDADMDGVGDNSDVFPNDANETMDSDMDGVGDNADAFPNDANETMDSDMDGVGDNSDVFPNDANETMDSDMDGVGDNVDAFPNDANETMDLDKDGVGDNVDAFPNDANETMDSDKDGVGDNVDAFPNDANKSLDSDGNENGVNNDSNGDESPSVPGFTGILGTIALLGAAYLRRNE